jgi:hypothetical protein
MFSQKKETKEKATPSRLFPVLLNKMGDCGTRFAQTVLVEIPPSCLRYSAQLKGVKWRRTFFL